MELLNLTGITEEAFTEAKAEASEGGFILDSGAYKMAIVEAAIFDTASKATMMKLVLKDKDDKEYTEYVNTSYNDKTTGERTENKSGAHFIKSLLAAAALDASKAEITEQEIKAYAKDVKGKVITNLAGRAVIAMIRKVDDSANSAEYPESNTIEAFADIEGNINGSPENLDKWKAKIEKAPMLLRKKKKGSTVTKASSTEAVNAAKSLLDD